jgi:molybdenum cofactor cytidylyltransferase
MKNPEKDIGAIILAAGAGVRMGGVKQLLKIGGRTLVARAAESAIGAGCRPVVVVLGANAAKISAELAALPVRCVHNNRWETGIGSSLRAGVLEITNRDRQIDGIAILVCDQAHLSPAVVGNLLTAWRLSGKSMAACEYDGTLGTPCCFGTAKFASLAQLSDSAGAKGLLMTEPAEVTRVPWPEGAVDLDRPEDWQAICSAL